MFLIRIQINSMNRQMSIIQKRQAGKYLRRGCQVDYQNSFYLPDKN